MSRRRRNKLVVPEARQALDNLKAKVLQEYSMVPQGVKADEVTSQVARKIGIPFSNDYNGDLTTKNAGKIGGNIGGKMVRELVKMAQQQIANQGKYKY